MGKVFSSCCCDVSDVEPYLEENNIKKSANRGRGPKKKQSSNPCESNDLDFKGNHKAHKDAVENKEVDCKILKDQHATRSNYDMSQKIKEEKLNNEINLPSEGSRIIYRQVSDLDLVLEKNIGAEDKPKNSEVDIEKNDDYGKIHQILQKLSL